jgi:DNA-binding transcriptional LysR family regulator
MMPTARALELAGPVGDSLLRIDAALQRKSFDPAGDWTFRLAISDQAALVVLPELLRIIGEEAPGIQLQVSTKRNSLIKQQLAAGDVDIAVGIIPALSNRYSAVTLFRDRYVCLMKRDHSLAIHSEISMEAFTNADHLALRSSYEHAGQIDETLAAWGYRRRVGLTVNQLAAVPLILANSNLISCILESVAKVLVTPMLRVCSLPFHEERVDIIAASSVTQAQSAAHKWMNANLAKACESINLSVSMP